VLGTDDGGLPQGSDGSSFDFCSAMQARATSCKATFDAASCNKTKTCIAGAVRADLQSKLESCLASSPCGATSDACLTTLGEPYAGVEPFSSYETKCAAKRAACASFPEDYCAVKYAVGTPEVVDKMSACMDLACDGVPPCFKSVLSSYGCNN